MQGAVAEASVFPIVSSKKRYVIDTSDFSFEQHVRAKKKKRKRQEKKYSANVGKKDPETRERVVYGGGFY